MRLFKRGRNKEQIKQLTQADFEYKIGMRHLLVVSVVVYSVAASSMDPNETTTILTRVPSSSASIEMKTEEELSMETTTSPAAAQQSSIWVRTAVQMVSILYDVYSWTFTRREAEKADAIKVEEDEEPSIITRLGWRSFPAILDRLDPVNYGMESFEMIDAPASVHARLWNVQSAPGVESDIQYVALEPRPEHWTSLVRGLNPTFRLEADPTVPHCESASVSDASYEAVLERLACLVSLNNRSTDKTIRQIAVDAERHGFPASAFDSSSISASDLMSDCAEVCSVYSLVIAPSFGYMQGMMDYCVGLKMGGSLSNADALLGIAAIVERVSQLSIGDITERSFVLAQLYIHMYEELHAIEAPSLFDRIGQAFVDKEDQLPGHQFGAAFQAYFISSGFRGNPLQVAKPELLPIVDFVLHHGRPGLIALLFAGLDINLDVMATLMQQGKHGEASRFISDPFAPGTQATVEDLVLVADTYMRGRVGEVPFRTAVVIVDILAEHFVPHPL